MNGLQTLAARAAQTATVRLRLRQGDVWTDANGVEHRVAEMSPRHAANVVRFLDRRARLLHGGACAEMVFVREPNGEQAAYDFDDERTRIYTAEPEEWLREQPLVRALMARAGHSKGGPSPGWLARHPVIAARIAVRSVVRP